MTEASFWNEQATVSRGWKRSTRYSSTPSASSSSRSCGETVGSAFVGTAGSLARKPCNSDSGSWFALRRTVGICAPTHHKSPFRLEFLTEGEKETGCRTKDARPSRRWRTSGPRRRRQTGERAAARAAPTSLGSQGGHDDDGVRGRRRPLWVLRLRPAAARPPHAAARRLRGHGAAAGADRGPVPCPSSSSPAMRRRGQAPGALGWRAGLPDQAVRPARGPPPRAEPPGDPAAAAPAAPDRARARAARRDAHRRAGGGTPRGARAPRHRRRVPRRQDRRARPARRRDRPLLADAVTSGDDAHGRIGIAAPLHDIGKIAIPDSLLLKAGRFTREEHQKMQAHTSSAQTCSAAVVRAARPRARHRAGRTTSAGTAAATPPVCRGEAIPLAGRIVALADVFDALTHARPYKPAWTVSDAVEEIKRGRRRAVRPGARRGVLRAGPRRARVDHRAMARIDVDQHLPGVAPAQVAALWWDTDRWPSFVDGFSHVHKREDDWPGPGGRLVWDARPASDAGG